MSQWSRRNDVAPARQAKIDTIRPLVNRRGYGFAELVPTKGNWKVAVIIRPESIDVREHKYWSNDIGSRTTVETESFDKLVATFSDDLLFARHIHRLAGFSVQSRYFAARDARSASLREYGHACEYLLNGQLAADEKEIAKREGEIARHKEAAIVAHAAMVEARVALDKYHATVPTTQAEASAYLATMPRVRDRPRKEE